MEAVSAGGRFDRCRAAECQPRLLLSPLCRSRLHAACSTSAVHDRVRHYLTELTTKLKGKGSPYSITERRVPKLIPFLGSQHAGDVSHKPGDKLPLLSARPAVTPATLKRAATNLAAW